MNVLCYMAKETENVIQVMNLKNGEIILNFEGTPSPISGATKSRDISPAGVSQRDAAEDKEER